jgi:hypothetical protein
MDDEINKLILELRESKEIKTTEISDRSANDVGEIYERYGYGATKAYLLDRLRKRKHSKEAKIFLTLLDKIYHMAIPREIGGFIIRKINSIKSYKENGH